MLRPYPARVCSHGLHEPSERRTPLLVVLEHVVARARGRQQDGVARSRRPAGAEHHILEGRPTLERHLAAERSEEHTSELQSPCNLVCRLLLEKKKKKMLSDLTIL